MPGNALIYHSGGLGDFVTTLPGLRSWRRKHSPDHTTFLGNKENGEIGQESGYFHELWDIDRAIFTQLFSGRAEKHISNRFDLGVLFTEKDSPIHRSVRELVEGELLVQAPFPGTRTSKIDYHLSLFGGRYSSQTPPLTLTGVEKKSTNPPRILVHPGSGSPLKNWPMKHFRELTRRLADSGFEIYWRIGPADESISSISSPNIFRGGSLVKFLRWMKGCVLFVGNDSGLAHCAASMGIPCVVVFGPSDPLVWRPWGHRTVCVCSDVICGPCHHTRPTGSSRANCNGECLSSISVDRVHTACMDSLKLEF